MLSEGIKIQIRITIIRHTTSILSAGLTPTLGIQQRQHWEFTIPFIILHGPVFICGKTVVFLHVNKAGLVMATQLTYKAPRTKLQPTCLLTEHGLKL